MAARAKDRFRPAHHRVSDRRNRSGKCSSERCLPNPFNDVHGGNRCSNLPHGPCLPKGPNSTTYCDFVLMRTLSAHESGCARCDSNQDRVIVMTLLERSGRPLLPIQMR